MNGLLVLDSRKYNGEYIYDKAPQTPNPAKNAPKANISPIYAALWIPILGNTTGVYSIASARWRRMTKGNVIANGLLFVMVGFGGEWGDRDRDEDRKA